MKSHLLQYKRDKKINNEELIHRAKIHNCKESEELLFKNNVPLMKNIVDILIKKYPKEEYDEFFSLATIGLTCAYKTFEPERAVKFSTYATRCIKEEILRFMRKKMAIKRTKYNLFYIDDNSQSSNEEDGNKHDLIPSEFFVDDYDNMITKLHIDHSVSKLNEKEKYIFRKRYTDVLSYQEIGDSLGTSKQNIQQIYKRSFNKIYHKIKY